MRTLVLCVLLLDKVDCHDVMERGTRVAISDSARDLGAVIDRELSLAGSPCHGRLSLWLQPASPAPTSSPLRSLSVNATKTLVQAFISCRLDYCNSLPYGMNYFVASSRCRTLPPAWSQAPVDVTTSHQCYGSCTGCQSVSESRSRSRDSYISRLLERLSRT